MPPELAIFVCARAADISLGDVTPGSIPGSCRECHQPIWRSATSVRTPGRVAWECLPCVIDDPSLDPETFDFLDSTYAELVRLYGFRPRESYRRPIVDYVLRARRAK